ncbi:MAG: site-specific DNA-methyltransferase [Deltaproteobacteria bacterium]|nr:site-specific DNA-methyltransferase [Deltaproteobacteria bacterium]
MAGGEAAKPRGSRPRSGGAGPKTGGAEARTYTHPEADSPLRPEVGTQAQFRKKLPPVRCLFDSSLSPALDWDGRNAARETGEWLIARIEEAAALPPPHLFDRPRELSDPDGRVRLAACGLADAVEHLKRMSAPFLDWAGKAERQSFDVPTLPLFVHERLSTRGIIETLKGHRRDPADQLGLFSDPAHPVVDQVLKAYEYRDRWVNRLVLGDSLVVMNSLLRYEGLGGQVQCIYMDPPYGVKFGSNFQPFVRKRTVEHNNDLDMTREPEMVKAYRDTWELGLHSYLTYLRDRLLLCRDLLSPSGSIFVQISDDNVHHVREVMDEVFGDENRVNQISFVRGGQQTKGLGLATTADYILWYARDKDRARITPLLLDDGGWAARSLDLRMEMPDGQRRRYDPAQALPEEARLFTHRAMESARETGSTLNRFPIEFEGRTFRPRRGWSTTPEGAERLKSARRLLSTENSLRFLVYLDDFPYSVLTANWTDTGTGSFTEAKSYVVQTSVKVIQRCLLMTTQPGDLVLDPTCGSGTTPFVAEQWGRRWIAIDTSRVPLALARQRLLTATYPYYQLQDEGRGPGGGFVYKRRRNSRGEEDGGIVPHVTLKSIANDEPPEEEVLVDRPEVRGGVTRVSGPFVVEATIPAPMDWEGDGVPDTGAEASAEYVSFSARMLEVLRRSPVLHLGGGATVRLRGIRPPAKTLCLSAEALIDAPSPEAAAGGQGGQGLAEPARDYPSQGREGRQGVAIVFGPENGAVSEKLVYEAAREGYAKGYRHLYVIGFAIQPGARELVDSCDRAVGLPATYVQATTDLMMGDLLKNLRSSQIFSVCGLPDVVLRRAGAPSTGEVGSRGTRYEVELKGLDVFDPSTMEVVHRRGDDVPAWLLDTDYNGLCFHVNQAFFPRTSAWENLKRALKASYDESVWDHLAGTISAAFEAGDHRRIAVKVIDDRGNELMVIKDLSEAGR